MRVLDLGGNIGLFGLYAFARFSIEEMTSFEPDPSNVALLRETIRINGYETKWSVEQVAVGTRDGRLPFAALGAPESRAAARGEPAIEVPIIDLFNVRKPVELMKIDIEGGEWALLGDPRLRAFDASVIIAEWHARDAPSQPPHDAALTLLDAAGYEVVDDHQDPVHHIGTMWARRREPAAGR